MNWSSLLRAFIVIIILFAINICVTGCNGTSSNSTAPCPPTIQQGSQGSSVKTLQKELNTRGWRDQQGNVLEVDGIFGPKTDYAVQSFQASQNLEVDGIVGPETWHALGYC